jgi:hypothetical protein
VDAQTDEPGIRTRGLIRRKLRGEDAEGRERILVGAPIPPAAHRVRTNDAQVRGLWGKRYPNADRYVELYRTYHHATDGGLILDEGGFDRVAIGDPVPDSNVGQRLGPSTAGGDQRRSGWWAAGLWVVEGGWAVSGGIGDGFG